MYCRVETGGQQTETEPATEPASPQVPASPHVANSDDTTSSSAPPEKRQSTYDGQDADRQAPYHPDDAPGLLPTQSLKGRDLVFQRTWFQTYPWLHYNASATGILCFYCATAETLGLTELTRYREDAFTSRGFANWKKALQRFREHARSTSHRFAVERVSHHYATQPVDAQVSSQHAKQQSDARDCLEVIFTSIRYLARQGVALRGHENEDGNFRQLLLLRSNDLPMLKQWLQRKSALVSPQAQNEILQLFANAIVRSIADKVRKCEHFSVIVDGTQDVSGKEQLSICLRYVDEEFVPHEEFIGLYEPPRTTGSVIADCIKDVFIRLNLQLSMLRGQTYDGASNMSGEYRGCQAIIAAIQPLATYVHCGAHCVNLVSQAVNEACPAVRDALHVVNELGSLFSQSLTARTTFKQLTESATNRVRQIRPLCPTRWLVRVQAVETLVSQYEPILQCLDQLAAPGSALAARAGGLRSQLGRAATLLALQMSLRVFRPLEMLNRALQSSVQTVSGMMHAVDEVKAELVALRSDEEFEAVLTETIKLQESIDLDPIEIPRQRRPPARYTGAASSTTATTVAEHYRPIYFALMDQAVTQLTDRFSNSPGLKSYQQLENVLTSGDVSGNEDVVSSYPELTPRDLAPQLQMFRRTRPVTSLQQATAEVKQMMPEVRAEYSQVCQLIRLLLVSPAASAQAERSFSALRRLKTWLRSSMTEVRLNSVAVCNVHPLKLESLDLKPLMREFVRKSDMRTSLFGQFVD